MEREVLKSALAPGAACLSLEQLALYADGALGAEEKAAADDHVRGCLNCQAELDLLHAVTSTGVRREEADMVREGVARLEQRAPEILEGAGDTAPVHARRWLRFGMPPLAAVAAVVLLVVGGLYLRVPRAPELPSDVTTGGEVTRSLAVTVRGPVGDQAEAPRRLEWLAVDGAARYRVRLMEVDRREVWSTTTSAVGVDLPLSVQGSLTPGRTLTWDVTAYA